MKRPGWRTIHPGRYERWELGVVMTIFQLDGSRPRWRGRIEAYSTPPVVIDSPVEARTPTQCARKLEAALAAIWRDAAARMDRASRV